MLVRVLYEVLLIGADGGGAVAVLKVASRDPSNHPNALPSEVLLFVGDLVEFVESLYGMNRENVLAVCEAERLVVNHPRQVLQCLEV